MLPSPIIVQIGSFALRWYSLLIVLGAVVAAWIATREARRRGQDPENIWQMLPLVLVLGIVGARLGWVLVSLDQLRPEGWQHIFYVWEGGLSIQGALIGGLAGMVLFTTRRELDFFEWGDIVIPGVALAQAIGRWGNFFNQEAFGAPCTQPWCIPISDQVLQSNPAFQQYVGTGTRFAPTFAYEMIWDLANFALLVWLGRQRRAELRTGDLLWVYAIFYSIGRFFIEGIRLDSATLNGVKAPEIFALLTIVIAWGALIYRHRPGSTAPVAVVAAAEVGATDLSRTVEWEEPFYAADGTLVEATEYAVDEDITGRPVTPVPHPVPVVAQSQEPEGEWALEEGVLGSRPLP